MQARPLIAMAETVGGIQCTLHKTDPRVDSESMINYGVFCVSVGGVSRVGTILRNGTERNDGLNYGTERFLKLKLATYHC